MDTSRLAGLSYARKERWNRYWSVGTETDTPRYPHFDELEYSLSEMLYNSKSKLAFDLEFDHWDCKIAGGRQNCSHACSDFKTLFEPTNIRPCVLLAAAALLEKNRTIIVDVSNTATAATVEALGIPSLSTFLAVEVLTNVGKCIAASCSQTNLGKCTDGVRAMDTTPVSVSQLQSFSTNLGEYCSSARPEINGDIAGPGVMVSYFFQASLSLYFFFLLKICTTWIRRSFTPLGAFKRTRGLRHWGNELQAKLARSRFGAAVVSSLVEFQEVQIYLTASIQIATLISYNSRKTATGLLVSDSFASAAINSQVAWFLSMMSMGPVLMVQCALQRSGMHWWYSYITMSAASIMAVVITFRTPGFIPSEDQLWDKFKADMSFAACGDNPSPMVLCNGGLVYWTMAPNIIGAPFWLVVLFGVLAWISLLLDQLVVTIRAKFPSSRLVKRLRKLEHIGALRWLLRAYWFLVETFLIIYAICYISFLAIIVGDIVMDDASQWGFGQLIAALVFTPTAAKYIYYNLFGIKEGFEQRLAKPYTVIKRPDSDLQASADGQEAKVYLLGPENTSQVGNDATGLLGKRAPDISTRTWTTYEQERLQLSPRQ
ncbi:hypothetical protein QBC43DRAFT_363054 [Cladorrhinum sp. PSN259]|nr:hypothetical protein QBC43DRAFT_363054 [Cladorrhinum sp. PSN259]